MSERKNNSKLNSNGGFNLSSITGILSLLTSAFSIGVTPPTPLPPPLILSSGKVKGGLSARNIASRIMSRRSEAGLPSGDIFPDGPNTDELMERIRAEEYVTAIISEAVVQVAILPGQLVIGTGIGNLGTPIAVQASTTTIGTGTGAIS